jgi:hypothetical protein
VGFQKSVTHGEQWLQATRSYSLTSQAKPNQTMQNRSTLDALMAEICHWVARLGWAKATGTVRSSTVVVANVLSEHDPVGAE